MLIPLSPNSLTLTKTEGFATDLGRLQQLRTEMCSHRLKI